MKLIKNKKATENWVLDSILFLILSVIILGFSILIFLVIIDYFASKDVEIPKGVEEFILIERFYNSPDCFAYQDEQTGRVYQKSIDLNKFKDKASLSKCFLSSNPKYAFKLELENPENQEKIVITTPDWANNADFRLEQRDVFIYLDNKIENRKLSISIQNA